MQTFVTILAALAGLAFGSFLNVCLSRWPEGESVVAPRSHCRACGRTLTWWENVPLVSWLALGGRCRTCKAAISWRYPAVELLMGGLWASAAADSFGTLATASGWNTLLLSYSAVDVIAQCLFFWLLVALALLDAEHLWLPDWLTLPGTALGLIAVLLKAWLRARDILEFYGANPVRNRLLLQIVWHRVTAIVLAAGLILAIRWVYWLVRRREGVGLGDAKLMALLAAWLGLPGALLAFALGVLLGALVGVVVLARGRREGVENPALARLPLGTFLCLGGIVSSLWGPQMISAYLRYAGFY